MPHNMVDLPAGPHDGTQRLHEPQAGTRKRQPGRTIKLARNGKNEDITLERD
jgi:hypothetical protein